MLINFDWGGGVEVSYPFVHLISELKMDKMALISGLQDDDRPALSYT